MTYGRKEKLNKTQWPMWQKMQEVSVIFLNQRTGPKLANRYGTYLTFLLNAHLETNIKKHFYFFTNMTNSDTYDQYRIVHSGTCGNTGASFCIFSHCRCRRDCECLIRALLCVVVFGLADAVEPLLLVLGVTFRLASFFPSRRGQRRCLHLKSILKF